MSANAQRQNRKIPTSEIIWVLSRVVLLVLLQLSLDTVTKLNWLSFLGAEAFEKLVYDVMKKVILTLYLWLFVAVFKKFVISIIIRLFSPFIEKFVIDPVNRSRNLEIIRRYLTYVIYTISAVVLINIWAYSYVGVWLAGTLGTGVAISLTFVLGLFTSSVLGNVLAYWVLSNVMEFKAGDRIQVGDAYGDVINLGLFFTRIKTIKDETISIPNILVVGREIKNYSSLSSVLIHVSVTLGYCVDKDDAKSLLIKCAEATEGVLLDEDKRPFVLLTELDRYTVTYEINSYTDKPNKLIQIKSDLIDNILSGFKEARIELLSPAHVSVKGELNK